MSNEPVSDEDDDVGRIRRRRRRKKKQLSDSEDDDIDKIPEPFSNQISSQGGNPYQNMSRLDDNTQNVTHQQQTVTLVTPERTSRSSSFHSTSPYRK